MCPACLTTAALVAAGSTSAAGGIGAVILSKLFKRGRRNQNATQDQTKAGSGHESQGQPPKPMRHTSAPSKSQ